MENQSESLRDNTKALIEIVRDYVSTVVSDIYKVEGVEVKRMPGQRGTWIVSVEAIHSERNSSMAYFSFVFKASEVRQVLMTGNFKPVQRTGKE